MNVAVEDNANIKLVEISKYRKKKGIPNNKKIGILMELIEKEHKRTFKNVEVKL